METKICKDCGQEKEFEEFGTYLKTHNSGNTYVYYWGHCKECSKKRKIKWKEENKEYVNKQAKESQRERRKNPEIKKKISESNKKYREKNKEAILNQNKKWRKENKKHLHEYYQKNKTRINQNHKTIGKKYYQKNKVKINQKRINTDYYIYSLLGVSIREKEDYKQLIEAKRIQLMIVRKLKEMNT